MTTAPGSTLALDSGAIASHRVHSFRILPDGPEYLLDSFRFEGEPKKYITVGSHPNSDIRVSDPAVSRNHCLIEQSRRAVTIRDCGSKNGIWINGTRIDEYVLTPGTVIIIGATQLLASGMSGKVRIVGASLGSFIHNAVIIYGGNVRFTAGALGVPRSTFSDWLRRKFRKDPEA
jgi:hypothetical protein